MFFHSRRVVVALAAVLLASVQPAAGEVTLAWKFTPGEKLHYVMTQQMHQDQKVGDQNIQVDMTMTMDMNWEVQKVDAGVATIAQTIDRIRMKMKLPQDMKAEYDSAAEDQGEGMGKQLAAAFAPVLRQPITVKMNAQGKVLDVELPQALAEKIENSPALKPMKEMLSREGMKQMTGMSALPDKPLAAGGTWNDSMTIDSPTGGKLTAKSTFTYVGPKTVAGKAVEEISVAMDVGTKPDGDKAPPVDIKVKDAKGVLHFDNVAGRLQDTKTTMKLATVVKVMGQEIKGDADITVRLELAPPGSDKPAKKPVDAK